MVTNHVCSTADVWPNLPQLLSCSWQAGVPTLTPIPHVDPPSFKASAQAFAAQHSVKLPAQLPGKLSAKRQVAVYPSADDMGEKISRSAVITASLPARQQFKQAKQAGTSDPDIQGTAGPFEADSGQTPVAQASSGRYPVPEAADLRTHQHKAAAAQSVAEGGRPQSTAGIASRTEAIGRSQDVKAADAASDARASHQQEQYQQQQQNDDVDGGALLVFEDR